MVPNKDMYALSMQKRREIQDSVMTPADRVREILSKPEEAPKEEAKKETKPKKKKGKKNGNK